MGELIYIDALNKTVGAYVGSLFVATFSIAFNWLYKRQLFLSTSLHFTYITKL